MTDNLRDQFELLPSLLSAHLVLSLSAILLGLAISVPLGIVSTRNKWLSMVTTSSASIIQTIPSLAFLALMVPLLGGVIGFTPAFIALTLYSLLPALRNTVVGIQGVQPSLVEAARGMGMCERQVMWRVQLPLAVPTILAGVRTSAVWVVGIATLSTPVGASSLGNYIFVGLQTRNNVATLFGCVAAALLAVVLDQLIAILQSALQRHSVWRGGAAACGFAALLALCLMPADIFASNQDPDATAATPSADRSSIAVPRKAPVILGSKTFTEQYILSQLIAQRLEDHGFQVDRRPGMGTSILFDALRQNQIDCYVDYSGTVWANVMKQSKPAGPVRTLIDVATYLKEEYGIISLGSLGFENTYAIAMPRQKADDLGIRSIQDLVSHSAKMKLGGDYEFFGRPEWRDLRTIYGLSVAEQIGMDAGLMYEAAARGSVDAIVAFSTDGRIDAFDFQVIQDTQQVLPPYDAILLLSPKASQRRELVRTLRPLINSISTTDMRWANKLVDVDRKSPSQAAQELLARISIR